MYICCQNVSAMIENPPRLKQEHLVKAFKLLSDPIVKSFVEELNDSYYYWSDVKYKRPPIEIDPVQLWACVIMSRTLKKIEVWDKYGVSFSVSNKMQRQCHDFDMNFGGSWGDSTIIPAENKERYLISSLMEEAISSSQMEGASTTRKVAKEMLRKSISPRSRSEQMISNNYETIHFIVRNKNQELTPDLLLQIHALMTHKTLENAEDEGRFRINDDVVVANDITQEIVHTPPSHTEITSFVDDLCKFFNTTERETFIHPIIKAIIIHFMIAYVHPFVDGNGRTGRALFYWYMLRNGYWLMEYMSISRIIYKSKPSYEKSFLFSEADSNDIGYFITYNLRVLELAFKELQNYIKKKSSQRILSSNFLQMEGINDRQSVILSLVKENPQIVLTIKEVQNRFMISNPTARIDIEGLVAKGYLKQVKVNKVKSHYIKGPQFDELIVNDRFQ